MTILADKKTWHRHRPANETRRSTDLTLEEQANVRVAMRFLATRLGDVAKLAKAMGAHRETVNRPARGGVVSAGIALRVAKVAGVPLESVLAGTWPPGGACPHCGRC